MRGGTEEGQSGEVKTKKRERAKGRKTRLTEDGVKKEMGQEEDAGKEKREDKSNVGKRREEATTGDRRRGHQRVMNFPCDRSGTVTRGIQEGAAFCTQHRGAPETP